MNTTSRVGVAMIALSMMGAGASFGIGPGSYSHVLATVVIGTLGVLCGISVFSIGFREENNQRPSEE